MLRQAVAARVAEAGLDDEVGLLVLAVLDGGLDGYLNDGIAPARGGDAASGDEEAEPVGAFLGRVEVEGFRGIGPPATLELEPGPGLTLIIGRNGSGKSSFAEALEILLTGDNVRWAKPRSKIWREGWRNLHHADTARIHASMVVEGAPGPTTVAREWGADAAEVDDSSAWVQRHGAKRVSGLDDLGWAEALANYRPFLSYNELGSMLDEGPSKLYDALSAILGLDDLVQTQEDLRQARLARDKLVKDARQVASVLAEEVGPIDDERARAVAVALAADPWDLDAIERAATGEHVDAEGELDSLRALATIATPEPAAAVAVAEQLRAAEAAQAEVRGSQAERDAATAELLERALALHDEHGGDCPVCGRELDPSWHGQATEEVARLRGSAARAHAARSLADHARAAAADLMPAMPGAADRDAVLVEAWKRLLDAPAELPALAGHLEATVAALAGAAEAARASARQELERKESAWRPVAVQLAAWLEPARAAARAATMVKPLKKAEEWLKGTAADIRDERFAPIAEQSITHWELLRTRSNVALGRVALAGSGTQRRVALDVTVDGVDGAALGVMSQGELHSLALSLFLPRATLPESPFRFLVIDDPVQSMDPARVDGLARVLEGVAKTRQVLVFTHDDRLPEAVRRLRIQARAIEVMRREGSVVELRTAFDPVERHIADAFAVALTENLPAKVGMRVVPGLCRQAIEAAAQETFRRRRLLAGASHLDVEEAWERAQSTKAKLALAMFDDKERAGEVLSAVNKAWSRRAGDALVAVISGAHEGFAGDLEELARSSERLCEGIRDTL